MSLLLTSIFTLHDPADQDALFARLVENAETVLENAPGFLRSTLSRSDDGATVLHHAVWDDDASVQAMLQQPRARASMLASKSLADVTLIRSHNFTDYSAAELAR